jgi:cytochrome c556
VISFKHILTAAVGVLIITVSVRAQDDSHMSMHMMPQTADNRQLVDLPSAMRQHMLSNMRALGEIVTALSTGDSAKAAAIAETRLGLDSPDAAACTPNRSADAPAMAAMMAEHMPEEMRNLGFAMHAAASTFAREAAKASQSNDVKPALAALSQVTQSCAACHSAYRLQ